MDIIINKDIKFSNIYIEQEQVAIKKTQIPIQLILQRKLDTIYNDQLLKVLCSNEYYIGYKHAIKEIFILFGGLEHHIDHYIHNLERN